MDDCPQVTFEFTVLCDQIPGPIDEDLVLDISITFLDRPEGWESDSTSVRVEVPRDVVFHDPATAVAEAIASGVNDRLRGTGVKATAEGGGWLPSSGRFAGKPVARVVLQCVRGVDLRWNYSKVKGWWWGEPGPGPRPPPPPPPTDSPPIGWEDPSGVNVGPNNPLWWIGGRNLTGATYRRRKPVVTPENPLHWLGGGNLPKRRGDTEEPPVIPKTKNPAPEEWPDDANPPKDKKWGGKARGQKPDPPPADRKPDEPYGERILRIGVYVEGNGNRGFPGGDLGWVIATYRFDAGMSQGEMGAVVADHWNSTRILPLGFEYSAIRSMMIGYDSSEGVSPSPMHWDLSLIPPAFVSVAEGADQDEILADYVAQLAGESAWSPHIRGGTFVPREFGVQHWHSDRGAAWEVAWTDSVEASAAVRMAQEANDASRPDRPAD
ncbi:MAG: hypothetical protein O2894_13830 [Planctomycetota bacterium]|nr:hypothetical protein [Planctomycetota bacterium]